MKARNNTGYKHHEGRRGKLDRTDYALMFATDQYDNWPIS
jgi:hypothetical protein